MRWAPKGKENYYERPAESGPPAKSSQILFQLLSKSSTVAGFLVIALVFVYPFIVALRNWQDVGLLRHPETRLESCMK
jgi:hypothetical protein